MSRLKKGSHRVVAVLTSVALALSTFPAQAIAEELEQQQSLEAQASIEDVQFEVDSLELYVGETKEVKLSDVIDDSYGYSYSYCIDADVDSGAGVATIKGKYPGKGTLILGNDGATLDVTVLGRPAGSNYGKGTSGGVTWSVDSEAANPEEIVLTIRPTNGSFGTLSTWSWYDGAPWADTAFCATKVVIEPGVKANTCEYMFDSMDQLRTIEGLQNLNTEDVQNMYCMFSGCSSLTDLDASVLNTQNVTDMSFMFSGMNHLMSLQLGGLFNTGNVTNMMCMFDLCQYLPSIDVSSFDTSNVTNMSSMFANNENLSDLDLSNFDTRNVTNMSNMFACMQGLDKLDISEFDTSSVTDMTNMFTGWGVDATRIVLPSTYKIKNGDGTSLPVPEGQDAWVDLATEETLTTAELIDLYSTNPRAATWVAKDSVGSDNSLEAHRERLADAKERQEKAQDEYDKAKAAYDEAKAAYDKTYEQLGSDVAAAEKAVSEKGEALEKAKERQSEAAQAAIAGETADPGTNENHREWTAYGIFQAIRDNCAQ